MFTRFLSMCIFITVLFGVTFAVCLFLFTPSDQAIGYTPITQCVSKNGLQDPKCTPGETDPSVTQGNIQTTICVPGYTQQVRKTTESMKRLIDKEYGYVNPPEGSLERDHLISLELGGADSIKNLWDQTAPDFHVKDKLENLLHERVCSNQETLKDAQKEILNWKVAAKKYSLAQ